MRFQIRREAVLTLIGCDSDWAILSRFLRFYYAAVRLGFVLLAAEAPAIAGLRCWNRARFAILFREVPT